VRYTFRLQTPYGGTLIDLAAGGAERERLLARASSLPSLTLTPRALHDLELMATGAFSPLSRFMGREDYDRVLAEMRLADGTLWPMPITLRAQADAAAFVGRDVTLRDANNDIVAVMTVDEAFEADNDEEAGAVLGTTDARHPLVAEMAAWPPLCLSGALAVLNLPRYDDFPELRLTPVEVRARLAATGRARAVAFQTRNPIHRSHEELTKRAMAACDGALLLHPVVGLTKPGDVDHYTRVRTYRALVEGHYDAATTVLALLPLAMRMAGPREALWHAIIRRNYGATHFIVGRDHAGPGADSHGKPFYPPYGAQELCLAHADEIGMTILPFKEMVYLPGEDRYEEADRVPPGADVLAISGTQVRDEYLAKGRPLPAWFTRPEVARILADAHTSRGFCVWFTGLSGAGKSATAEALVAMLMAGGRQVTLLDGDVVRTHLSKGLGFSREDRDTNIRRIGFVASEIVRHGGAVICAAVSPYAATRDECRALIGSDRFIEVFVDTPIEVCEQRDTKGLYEKARRGELRGFTGIDDPYEPPPAPDVRLTTTDRDVRTNAAAVLAELARRGLAGERT
jgi:sulfate adenylyltransferase